MTDQTSGPFLSQTPALLVSDDGTIFALYERHNAPGATHELIALLTNGNQRSITINRRPLREWCQMILDATA